MAAPCGRMASLPLKRYFFRFGGTPVLNCMFRSFSNSSHYCSILRKKLAPETPRSPWTLMAAVCLQRPPVISADLNPLEQRFARLMQQMEVEKSILSDHELRLLEDAEKLRRKQADDYDEDEEEDDRKGQDIVLTQDLEDEWERKFKAFRPAPRVIGQEYSIILPNTFTTTSIPDNNCVCTEDVDKNLSSLGRLLADSLVLLSEQRVGSDKLWMLPQAEWRPGETLRDTAQRALDSLTEPALKATFLGQAPCGVYKYKLPKDARSDTLVGTKIFFFKAMLTTQDAPTNVEPNGALMWLNKQELRGFLKPAYMMKVERFIHDL
ncbi:large ribosomal subunit protein mL46 isoform X1 [Syngnathus scovelli]|uniref:large ribosomal subunit protein mL46 isoform X1 n=1 Tax=Syngnathus scovelli TaxID=161590 RepID=UPI00210FDCB2|nr:39S ribosomal protein L46, mitochondrial isoform X1 [Syngnathus scovelli]